MATSVNRSVNIFIQSGEAEKAYDRLIKKEQVLKDELAKATDPAQIKKLNAELEKLQEPIGRAAKKMSGELAPTLREQTTLVKKLEQELKNLGHDDPGFHKKVQQFQQANLELQEMRSRIQQVNASLKDKALSGGKSFLEGLGIGAGVGLFESLANGVRTFFQGTIDESLQAKRASEELKLSLENFGDIKSFKVLTDQAEELAKKFSFLDNDDIVEAQTKLVDFGKLSTNQIQKLIPVIIDYAAKTKQSVPEASQEFIKALNGQSREMKQFGVQVKETNGVTQNFNVLTTDLARKVKGAADVFGESAEGKIASFKQSIKNAQETVGDFILAIIEGPKSAGQLFDEAKKSTDDYENSLHPLLQRYDELKGKTSLNKDEQNELRGVIQKIVELVPDSVTEFNKYGEALDINRGKVENFLKVNKQILAEKEVHAINEAIDGIKLNLKKVNDLQTDLNRGFSTHGGAGVFSLDEEGKADMLSQIRDFQIKAVEAADILKEKYSKELPKDLKVTIDNIRTLLTAVDNVGNNAPDKIEKIKDTIAELQKQIQAVTADRDNAIIGTKEYNDAVARLKVLQDRLDKLLNKNQTKPKENLFDKFIQQIKDQARELDSFNKAQIDKDLTANEIKYDKIQQALVEAFKKRQLTENQYGDLILQNADNRGREQSLIYKKWVEEINKNQLDEEKKKQQKLKELDDTRLQQLITFQEKVAKNAAEVADKALGRRQFQLEVDELLAHGKEKLKIKIQQLNLERDREIANAKETNKDVNDINRKYDQLIQNEKVDSGTKRFEKILGVIQEASNVLNLFFDAASQRDQQQLEQERITNDRKKDLYKRQLDGKLLSQKEYDKKVQQLEKQQDEREKQVRIREFNRNKITNLINTSITVARGVAEALATPPAPNVGLATFMGILGGIQLAFIAAQKPPKLGKGGRLDGPAHSQGGMPILNPATGRKVAEVEGGEVVLSRNTVRNNAALVDQLLHSSLFNNGDAIVPRWRNSSPSYLNIPVINESINRVRMFEKGGIVSTTDANDATQANTAVLAGLQNSIQVLNAQLASGITAFTLITQHEKQQQRLDTIRNDATFK